MTFNDFVRMGLGCLGLTPSVFYDMDFIDFHLAMEGWNEAEEQRQQMEWERTRWLAATMLAPHGKKGRPIQPRDLIQFPWDSVSKRRKLPKAKQADAFRQLMAIAKPKKT